MKLTVVLGSLASVNILLVFSLQWLVVTTLGPGVDTDAFFAGLVVPLLVLAVVSESLTHVLVPLLSSQTGDKLLQDGWTFLQGIFILIGVLTVGLFLTASVWVPWTVPGFDVPKATLTASLVRIQLAGMMFTAMVAVLWSVNHARGRFVWVELSAVIANTASLGFLFFTIPHFGVVAGAWAMVLRAALQFVLLLPSAGRYRRPDWRSQSMQEAWRRIRPLLFGTVYYKTDQLVDRFLTSMLPTGGLTLLHLAQQLYGAGNSVLNKAVATPIVPRLANAARDGAWQQFQQIYRKRLMIVLAITGVGFLVVMLAGKPLLGAVFGHNHFSADDVLLLWTLLIALAGVLFGGATGQVLAASFYAKGDTVTPTRIGVVGFTLGLLLKIAGYYFGGVIGIAVGTTIYYLLNAVLLYVFLSRDNRPYPAHT